MLNRAKYTVASKRMGVLIPCMECACSSRCLSPGAPQAKDRYLVWIGKSKFTLSGNGCLSHMWALQRDCDLGLKSCWERLHLPTASSGSDDEEWSAFLSCPAYSILCTECFIIRCCFVSLFVWFVNVYFKWKPTLYDIIGSRMYVLLLDNKRWSKGFSFMLQMLKITFIWNVLSCTFISESQG